MLTNLAAPFEVAHMASRDIDQQTNDPFAVVLAPLSGITDVPFRRLVRSFGTAIVYSEMVASGELLRGEAESFLRAQSTGAGMHAVQLAGRDPAAMEEAARHLAAKGADLIDINMGCPAKKVVGGASGAALMRDLDLARRIIAATVRGAGSIPVSVKMRLGWDRSSLNAGTLALAARDEGAVRITVHGRTRDQFYEGLADWDAIRAVAANVDLPVTANGDLVNRAQLRELKRRSGCASVMIGRGACGRPWAPALIAGVLEPADLSRIDLADVVLGHYDAMLTHYGVGIGLRHARKHLGWYLANLARHAGDLSADTAAILRNTEVEAVRRRLRDLFTGTTAADIETDIIRDKAA